MLYQPISKAVSVEEIASLTGASLRGNAKAKCHGLCPIEWIEPAALSFLKETRSQKVIDVIARSELGALLTTANTADRLEQAAFPLLVVANPLDALVKALPLFFEIVRPDPAINPTAEIHPTAKLGENVSVGAYCVIGEGCTVADGSILYPHVVLYPRVTVGENTVIHSGAVVREECEIASNIVIHNGAVIGADGFGYIPDPTLGLRPVPQVGKVELKDRVEVGANSCIDRATLGKTSVGEGTKIDNLVQIGHNCVIGSHSILCGQAGLAGSVQLGNQVVLGGSAKVADHAKIVDGVRLAGGAGVAGDINTSGDYGGAPAMPAKLWKRREALFQRLVKRHSSLKGRKALSQRESDSGQS